MIAFLNFFSALGSTGHWLVPSGDTPLDIGTREITYVGLVYVPTFPSIPSGQWADDTGGSPRRPFQFRNSGDGKSDHASKSAAPIRTVVPLFLCCSILWLLWGGLNNKATKELG